MPAVIAALAGCGSQDTANRALDVSRVPLVRGAQIVARARQCDRGANPFCVLELVVADPRYRTSDQLVKGERHLLQSRRWSLVNGDTGEESAAESPGHQLRITYATAIGDLKGIDLVWIQRSRTITLALSRALFSRASAMSLMVQAGSS